MPAMCPDGVSSHVVDAVILLPQLAIAAASV